jgi:hypothetical protein
MTKLAQRTAEDQTIKAGQPACDNSAMFLYELLHGASPVVVWTLRPAA